MPCRKTLIDIVVIYLGGDRTGRGKVLCDGRYEQDTNTGKNAANAQQGSQCLQKPQHLLSTFFQLFAKRDQKRHTPACKAVHFARGNFAVDGLYTKFMFD